MCMCARECACVYMGVIHVRACAFACACLSAHRTRCRVQTRWTNFGRGRKTQYNIKGNRHAEDWAQRTHTLKSADGHTAQQHTTPSLDFPTAQQRTTHILLLSVSYTKVGTFRFIYASHQTHVHTYPHPACFLPGPYILSRLHPARHPIYACPPPVRLLS